MGFGLIELEDNEFNFYVFWEECVFVLIFVMGMIGSWNIDIFCYVCESLLLVIYLFFSYYEIWM